LLKKVQWLSTDQLNKNNQFSFSKLIIQRWSVAGSKPVVMLTLNGLAFMASGSIIKTYAHNITSMRDIVVISVKHDDINLF
jgi:hypothetical protein